MDTENSKLEDLNTVPTLDEKDPVLKEFDEDPTLIFRASHMHKE
jgi:hypothetical protein